MSRHVGCNCMCMLMYPCHEHSTRKKEGFSNSYMLSLSENLKKDTSF